MKNRTKWITAFLLAGLVVSAGLATAGLDRAYTAITGAATLVFMVIVLRAVAIGHAV
ncbi:MAG: hypothetical protein J7J06_10285 [Methanosarcinales archaeon]|nr:hypothetical protein [Methanosarcinales archaeon]